jgi:hypothetical protein
MKRGAWTEEERQILDQLYPNTPTQEIARRLGRKITAVYAAAAARGLKKTKDFMREFHAVRLQGPNGAGVASRFKPQQTPWNKGISYQPTGRTSENWFSPGNRPHTWVPVGTYRVNADGYLDRKIRENANQGNWERVHRLVWIEHHGPIPPGRIVVFRDGLRTVKLEEITIDRLELLTRSQLMARNSVHRFGEEIFRVHQLRGALTRMINRRSRDHGEND